MGSEKCVFAAIDQRQEDSVKSKDTCHLQGHHYSFDIYTQSDLPYPSNGPRSFPTNPIIF